MKFNNVLLMSILIITVLSSCKPKKLEIEIYTSDISSASSGEIVSVQAKSEFTLMGEDKKGILPKSIEVVKKYLSKDSEIHETKGGMGKVLSINTTIPFGKENELNENLKTNPVPIFLLFENSKVFLKVNDEGLKSMNRELRDINLMINGEFPSSVTSIKIISDQKQPTTVLATAVFSEKRAYLNYEKEIKHRKNIELVYHGGSGSVYKQLPPQFEIKF